MVLVAVFLIFSKTTNSFSFTKEIKSVFSGNNIKSLSFIVLPTVMCGLTEIAKNYFTKPNKLGSEFLERSLLGMTAGMLCFILYHKFFKQTPEELIAQYGHDWFLKTLNRNKP